MITLLEYIKKSGKPRVYAIPSDVSKIGELANYLDAVGAIQIPDIQIDGLMDKVAETGKPCYTFVQKFLLLVIPVGDDKLCYFCVVRKNNNEIESINQAMHRTKDHMNLGFDALYRAVDHNLPMAYDEMNKLIDRLS